MAAIQLYADLICELFESGKTHSEIRDVLQREGASQCSIMSIRRFCMEHNLRLRGTVSETALITSINRVGYVCM